MLSIDDLDGIPLSLYVNNLPEDMGPVNRDEFERIFYEIDESVTVKYSPKRAMVTFSFPEAAVFARVYLDGAFFGENKLRCVFTELDLLTAPRDEKVFLISPPSSPPPEWEAFQESPPELDYGLVVGQLLAMGEEDNFELHPARNGCPSIVLVQPRESD